MFEFFQPCLRSLSKDEDLVLEDGSLNRCLQCDEDKSGPNYQYFGGRYVMYKIYAIQQMP